MEEKKGLPKYGRKTDLERARARKIDSLLSIKKHKKEKNKDLEIKFETWEIMNKTEKKDYIFEIKDRLMSAYIELEELKDFKILTEMNFEDCQSCGVEAIQNKTKDTDFVGYVFYHMQDEENLFNNGTLHLSYGGLNVPDVMVGEKIVKFLNNAGLITEWNGLAEFRILILGFKIKNK